MQADNNDAADRRGSEESDLGGSGSPSQPLAGSRLRDKLQKFAKWRIDSSSIEFPEDAPEFRGGFATVSRAVLISTSYSAEDENKSDGGSPMRKAVAVKKLKIENGKDKERVLGLALREAGFLTELSHENVIKLEGFVEDLSEDRVWLVFPWAANGNLKDFAASANWEIPERIWLIDDVARGVEYLHNQNPPIYHGDLKSANVLVNSNRGAVVTDFGSARRLTKNDPPVQPEKSENAAQPVLVLETEFCEATNTMTLTGNQFTLRWAAPELLKDDGAGLWSDIWALGWIFYEVITNSIPFHDVQKDSAVFIRVIQGNLPSVADHTSMVLIRALYSLMIACWCIDPTKRPTAEDCRKSMSWMPMIVPDPQRASNTSGSWARSSELLMELGNMHRYQNDYINASKLYTEALGICTDAADNAGKAEALFGLATVHRLQYEYSKAVPLYSEIVQICTDTGNRSRRADALGGLAHVRRAQGEYNEALPLYSEAVQIFTDIGDRRGRANALWGLADVHRLQNQFNQAVQFLSEALQIRIDIGDSNGRAWALQGLANVHCDQDQHEDAIRLYEEAAGIFQEIGRTLNASDALNDATRSRQKLKPAEAE